MLAQPAIASFLCPTRLYFGDGAYKKLPEVLTQFNCTRLFVILDPGLEQTPFVGAIKTDISANKVKATFFTDISPDPTSDLVEKAHAKCQEHQATVILAIGGGSAIDIAKGVAIL